MTDYERGDEVTITSYWRLMTGRFPGSTKTEKAIYIRDADLIAERLGIDLKEVTFVILEASHGHGSDGESIQFVQDNKEMIEKVREFRQGIVARGGKMSEELNW